MAKPFDATTRELLASDPRAWLKLLLGRELGGADGSTHSVVPGKRGWPPLLRQESPEALGAARISMPAERAGVFRIHRNSSSDEGTT